MVSRSHIDITLNHFPHQKYAMLKMNGIFPLNHKVNLMKCNSKKINNLGVTVFCFLFDFTVINLSNPGQAFVRFSHVGFDEILLNGSIR